jgi:hypothetical protein
MGKRKRPKTYINKGFSASFCKSHGIGQISLSQKKTFETKGFWKWASKDLMKVGKKSGK